MAAVVIAATVTALNPAFHTPAEYVRPEPVWRCQGCSLKTRDEAAAAAHSEREAPSEFLGPHTTYAIVGGAELHEYPGREG